MAIATVSAVLPVKGSDGNAYSARTLPLADEGGVATVEIGNDLLATGQPNVGATATAICSARVGRGAITVVNHGTTDVFLGGSTVTSGTGVLLLGVKGASITLPFAGALYGVTATGSQPVSYVEVY